MSGGHHDAHSAGPNGITLNELHVADPAHTTEMFSIGSSFSVESALGTIASANKRKKQNEAFLLAYLVLLGNVLIGGLSSILAMIIANLFRGAGVPALFGMSAGDETLVFGIVFGVVFLLLCAAVLGVLSANGYKQKAEYKSPFAALKKHIINEDDPEADEEFARQRQRAEDRARRKLEQCELTFKDLLNPKHDHVTFGDLQLSYAVNNHAIVARSLGDRLVAVIGKSLIADAELGKDSDKDAVTWRGRHLTPAVVVTLDRHGYKSKLYIHGAHFERPGQGAKESKKRAIEFLEAVRCLKPTSTGGSGHH